MISDHFDGRRFFAPWADTTRSFADLLRWRRERVAIPWPQSVPLHPHAPAPAAVDRGQVGVTMIGHATFLLRAADAVWMTDPVFTSHAGPFGRIGPRRVRGPGLPPSALPPLDFVLVSHNHYDHLQPASLRDVTSRGAPRVIVPLGLRRVVERLGRPVSELDWWQEVTVGGATITCVPAQHFSARTPWDRNRTLWCGYVVQSGGTTVYFAGDTGYGPHFQQIGARCPGIDVALLPIGAYEPRWFMRPMHANPDEAVRAHLDLGARVSVGMHFGVFHLTDEGIDDPVRALEQARAAAGLRPEDFRVLDFGETVIV
ncbi:MAG: MBL fold metallo-hydrolase [Vicinamibacterales bacterium]